MLKTTEGDFVTPQEYLARVVRGERRWRILLLGVSLVGFIAAALTWPDDQAVTTTRTEGRETTKVRDAGSVKSASNARRQVKGDRRSGSTQKRSTSKGSREGKSSQVITRVQDENQDRLSLVLLGGALVSLLGAAFFGRITGFSLPGGAGVTMAPSTTATIAEAIMQAFLDSGQPLPDPSVFAEAVETTIERVRSASLWETIRRWFKRPSEELIVRESRAVANEVIGRAVRYETVAHEIIKRAAQSIDLYSEGSRDTSLDEILRSETGLTLGVEISANPRRSFQAVALRLPSLVNRFGLDAFLLVINSPADSPAVEIARARLRRTPVEVPIDVVGWVPDHDSQGIQQALVTLIREATDWLS